MTDTLSVSLRALATQSQRLAETANKIANTAAEPADLAQAAVTLIEIKTAVKSNVAVIKAEKEMTDRLLDTVV